LLESKAEVFYGNVYELPSELGQFDVAIVGSVLEHLSDQISALASIARHTNETIVVVSPLLDTDERIAQFGALAAHPENDFTWWIYSKGVYQEVFKMLGFNIKSISEGSYYYHYGERFETRHTIVAVRE
jgi:ubiquinone/menaquinone biosynthesis C-methylase UbiE